MPNEIDDILISSQNTQGYSGWILTRSGIAVFSTLDAIVETLTAVCENRVGYSAWVLQLSGINIPSIDEVIVGVPELEETITCVGTNIPSLEEAIVGTPIVPEPIPVSPGVGGGTYAPIFPQRFIEIEETLTVAAVAKFETSEHTTVEEFIVATVVNRPTTQAWYGKNRFITYPVIVDVELPPKIVTVVPKFPDELSSGITASERRRRQEQLVLLDLI